MHQQINLYELEFRRQDQPLSSKQILQISVVFFALLMLVEVVVAFQWYGNGTELKQATLEFTEVNTRLTALKQSQPLSQRPRLEAEIKSLTQQIQRRQELRSIISGQNLGNSEGFSHYLQAMARQSLPDIALTHIRLLQGGAYVELDGRVRKPEAVPEYLHRLREERSFDAVRFGVLNIQRNDEAKGSKGKGSKEVGLLFSLGKVKDGSS